jgi:hypothetical protein
VGIGGYMFQIIDGEEKPVAFISKAYDKTMRKWCPYQKEGFGIFYALKKWRHLLLDRKFILRTDCRNISFLEKDNDSKSGSKGDFIYRESDDNGIEIISIMFEMKNEGDETTTKKRRHPQQEK